MKKTSYLYNRPFSLAIMFAIELIKGVESPSSHGPEGLPLQRALGVVLHALMGEWVHTLGSVKESFPPQGSMTH